MRFVVQPDAYPVDQPVEVRVTAYPDQALSVGESIAFAPPESWSSQPYCITFTKEPQLADPDIPNYVTITAKGVTFDKHIEPIILPSGSPKGHVRKIVATVREGRVEAGDAVVLWLHNYRSAWLAESAHFRVFVNGNETANGPTIRTLAEQAARLRIIVPSCARPGDSIPVRIVSLDRFWNLSNSTFVGGELTLGDKVLESGIAFTGAYETSVQVGEPGLYRFRCLGALSNPVKVTVEPRGPYWGDLHGHDKLHNCGAGEAPFEYARHASCLDFVGVAPDFKGLGAEAWRWHVERTNDHNHPHEFATILSYEMGCRGGHHNVFFRDDQGWIFDVSNREYWTIDKFITGLDPATAFLVPHHLGIHWGPQVGYEPARDGMIPLLEIYSEHGMSEAFWPEHALSYEHNRTRGLEDKHATSLDRPVYARDAWAQGRRYGVIASSDGHMGQPGKPNKGLAAVLALENTRESLWDTLRARHCYGTTGERIIIDFCINGQPMGSELMVHAGDTLSIDFEVNGTDELSFVELVRYRFGTQLWETVHADRTMVRDAFAENGLVDPMDYQGHIDQVCESDALYYLRVGQKKQLDNWPVMAWSSPIWISVS